MLLELNNMIVKTCIMVIILYQWSQFYQGIFLTILGLMGIIWATSPVFLRILEIRQEDAGPL